MIAEWKYLSSNSPCCNDRFSSALINYNVTTWTQFTLSKNGVIYFWAQVYNNMVHIGFAAFTDEWSYLLAKKSKVVKSSFM